ncbi:pentapeptide repeat-containing protein [Streptomyces javensis]|uniref:pentapeptide repeat-containing protein n=1 Tax=Streptomyces javensis TaxID=114698 RepID=UPI0033CC410B
MLHHAQFAGAARFGGTWFRTDARFSGARFLDTGSSRGLRSSSGGGSNGQRPAPSGIGACRTRSSTSQSSLQKVTKRLFGDLLNRC